MLPIGGYAHSYGLENYVLSGKVTSVDAAREFVKNSLLYNIKYNDALYLRLAWEATRDDDYERLCRYDEECSALKSPLEIRQASLKLGVRLLKIFHREVIGGVADGLTELTRSGGGHYPVIYGAVAAAAGLPLRETLLSFYYNSMVCMVTNAVKLIPLGQLSGQEIIFELESKLGRLTDETIGLSEERRGICAVGFDLNAMQHERLYSRLYMS